MCYYSKIVSNTRDAKEQENLRTVTRDHHRMLAGDDGKIVCVMDKTTMHIENLQVDRTQFGTLQPSIQQVLRRYIGKSVSAPFVEYHSNQGVRGYAADAIMLDGIRIHLFWLANGMECYVGAKKVTLETKLGVDDPSIVHDHKPIDEMPTLGRALGVVGVCSITP